jgi:hypothetical protein
MRSEISLGEKPDRYQCAHRQYFPDCACASCDGARDQDWNSDCGRSRGDREEREKQERKTSPKRGRKECALTRSFRIGSDAKSASISSPRKFEIDPSTNHRSGISVIAIEGAIACDGSGFTVMSRAILLTLIKS